MPGRGGSTYKRMGVSSAAGGCTENKDNKTIVVTVENGPLTHTPPTTSVSLPFWLNNFVRQYEAGSNLIHSPGYNHTYAKRERIKILQNSEGVRRPTVNSCVCVCVLRWSRQRGRKDRVRCSAGLGLMLMLI